MTRQGVRRAAKRFLLAAVIVFIGAILLAAWFNVGHDLGALWFALAVAVAVLLSVISAITFLASFLVSG